MITAILLAAGESKRIPKENKLLKKFKSKPLVNHILESLIKSRVNKIIIVLGYEHSKVKKILIKKKKIILVINKDYKKGMSSSIKSGLKKVSKNNKGFMIIQSDMPYIKSSHINKINNSILNKNKLVHALKHKNRRGNPIGFNISVLNKFKKIKGDIGAKYIVKKLKKNTNFINVTSNKIFKDFDLKKDFN
jgi:molybdenum cofactor cytidylyltransferase|tara:strand:+ start:102 stop:674 length:573 start_codon:yes stop_codon:yes gene_type:complete